MMIILKIIAAIEILLGGFGLAATLYLTTYQARTGESAGIGWLL